MKNSIKNKYVLVLLLLLIAVAGKAQQKSKPADTSVIKLAKFFSVSPEKAAQIKNALGYGNAELRELASNTTMDFKQRQAAITRLQQERKRRIDSTLTSSQKAAYILRERALYANQIKVRQRIKQQQEQQPVKK